jgi:hypothetical protein
MAGRALVVRSSNTDTSLRDGANRLMSRKKQAEKQVAKAPEPDGFRGVLFGVWVAVLCVCSWVCLSGMDGPASLAGGVVFLCCGTMAAWRYMGQEGGEPDRWALRLWVIAGASGAGLLHGPWRWGWVAVAALGAWGLACRWRRGRESRESSSRSGGPGSPLLARSREALWMIARDFSLLGTALLLTEPIWARVHVLPGMAQLLWPLLRLSGVEVAVSSSSFRVSGYPEATTQIPSPQHLALDFAVLVAVGLASRRLPRAVLLRFALACVLWLPLRYVIVVLYAARTGDPAAFWQPVWVALSLLPLAAGTCWPVQDVPNARGGIATVEGGRRGRAGLVMAILGGACLGCALFFVDPGIPHGRRLLIDESHSPWESTEEAMGTESLSPLSGYNYYCFANWLDAYYEVRRHTTGPLDDGALQNGDVLMVKVPTRPFTPEEIRSIARFVAKGGGLWLIGDHTDVFGTSSCLNPLAQVFGVRFAPDATYDLCQTGLPAWRPPPYPRHPTVAQITNGLLVHTSCTLEATRGMAVMVGRALRVAQADFSQPHFFPGTQAKQLEFGFGPYPLCWCREYGKGRVVAYSDSTAWSNFLCFIPGKPELALGILQWLGRGNRFGAALRAALLCGVVLFGWAAFALCRGVTWYNVREANLAAWLAGGLTAGLVCGLQTNLAYPRIEFRARAPIVGFEGQYSDLFLPIAQYYDTSGRAGRDYHTFFVWSQRVGLVPCYRSTLQDALKQGQAVVIANPKFAPSEEDAASLLRFVQAGGRLLLLIGREPRALDAQTVSSANAILMPYGLRVEGLSSMSASRLSVASNEKCSLVVSARTVGGRAVWKTTDGSVVAAGADYGTGKVVVFTGAGILTTEALGRPTDTLTTEQQARARVAFALFRTLGLPPAGRRSWDMNAPAGADDR